MLKLLRIHYDGNWESVYGGAMLANLSLESSSRSSLNKAMVAVASWLVLPLALSACSEKPLVDSCTYLDAFEKEVALEELTSSKAHEDALEVISQGKIVFLGGYLETGPITLPLTQSEQEFPSEELDEILDRYGVQKIKKVFLTKKLNQIKSDSFMVYDDGVLNGSQVERDCYNSAIRSYAFEFNRTIIREFLKKK